MSPDGKIDLGTKVDALLGSWPAPAREDAAWAASAEAILVAAQSSPRTEEARLKALFEAPALEAEPGEPQGTNASVAPVRAAVGEKAMSQDSNPGPKPETGPASMPMSAAASKRPSLKELAARASQAGASGRQSTAPSSSISTIPPPVASKSISETPPPPADKPSRSPLPSAPPPRLSEAGKEDSGIVDLKTINESATPQQIAAAEKAKPAAHDLVDDGEDKAVAAADGAKVKSLAEAREKKQEKKGGSGATWGLVIAVVGLAAAGVIVFRNKGQTTDTTASGQDKPAVTTTVPKATAEEKIAAAPQPTSTGLSIDSLPSEPEHTDTPKSAQPSGGGQGEQKVATAPTTTEAAPAPTAITTATPTGTKPGDLESEMAARVGGGDKSQVDATDAVPAAKTGNQNIPEQPSQGSVASAVGAVMPGAKACVAGADDVSRAQITFSSSGKVSNVNVTGWAAANGKSGCVKSALSNASVGPFSKPTFAFSVTIRP